MTAMNIIYARYYPAGYIGTPGTAPEGAVDLTFSNIERTELAESVQSIAMKRIEIGGQDYYYGVAAYGQNGWITDFTVNDQTVEATRIDGTNVYYYTSEELTGSLYGTASLSYAEFYEGDIADTSAYDAVSSATTSKNNIFTNADSTEPVEGEGYQINGVKNVPIRVDAAQYAKAEILEAANALSGQSEGYVNAAKITLNEAQTTAPAWYKTLNADGSYSAMVVSDSAAKHEVTDATASLNTSSNWGDYLIAVDDPHDYLRDGREGTWPVDEDIMGIVVEAEKNGHTVEVGLRHLENIWVQTHEFAFDAEVPTADLEGATIKKITYIVPEGVYEYTFDGIYVLPQYPTEVSLSAAFDETQKYVTITGLPGDLENVKVNVYKNEGHGKKTVLVTDKLPDSEGKVSLDDGASVTPGVEYTVQISSSNYADLSTTVKVDSETPEPEPGEEQLTGEATVQTFGYQAKVIVTYDPTTGKIVSVEDNGTEPGTHNQSFWDKAKAMFAELIGKTKNEVDTVDAVSSATYSSNAIKEAVKNALPD